MKHLHMKEREGADERADETAPAPHVAPSDVRSSGVRVRDARGWPDGGGPLPQGTQGSQRSAPALAEAPRSFEDIRRCYTLFVWSNIQRWWISEPEARDILQNVLVSMFIRTCEQGVPAQAEVTVLLLRMIDEERRKLRRTRQRQERRIDGDADPDAMPSSKPDPEQLYARAEGCEDARPKMEAILAEMSEDASGLFELVDIEGLSPKEAAALLGRNQGTFRVQLWRW